MSKTRSKFDFVEVTWHDACSSQGWVTLDSLPRPSVIVSRGWRLHDEEAFISVAGSVPASFEDDKEYGEVITIPRGMIESVRVIEKARGG